MNRFKICVLWLKAVSVLFALFGVIIALLNQTPIFKAVFGSQINPVFWAEKDLTVEALRFQQWIYGLLGATCLLVGILIFFVIGNAFAKKERWARDGLLCGVAAWFAIDTPVSVYFRVYFNVAFNLALLIFVLIPVLLTVKDFKKRQPAD